MKRAVLSVMVLIFAMGLSGYQLATGASGTTELVSVSSSGTQGNSGSSYTSISADGRYVAFQSYASNLIDGDTNGTLDIFVRDRQAGTTEIVSVSSDEIQGSAESDMPPSISADGRYVAFRSYAPNLVDGDTNGTYDAFVRDRQTGTTERVSVSSTETQGNGLSSRPFISADGRYVVFESYASNLVDVDTNNHRDVFVRDRQEGTTERVSISSAGDQGDWHSSGGSITADGRYVVFESNASNLVEGDTNNIDDVFVRDRQTGTTERVSISSSGIQGNEESNGASISADGRYVAFRAIASNLVEEDTNNNDDVFVRDRQTGTTERVSISSSGVQGNWGSNDGSISTDGRYVTFTSGASNLVEGDTNGFSDVFVRDRQTGTTERVSLSSSGDQGNGYVWDPSISSDARYVAFRSEASNLVDGGTNGYAHVFIRNRGTSDGDFPPVLTAPGEQQVQFSDAVSITLSATDPDGPASELRFSAADLPSGLTLTDNEDGTATISGNLQVAAGRYEISVTVTDDTDLTDEETLAIVVQEESVETSYTGDIFVMTAGPDISTAPVRLAATLTQQADGGPGDIALARVRFELTRSGNSSGTPDQVVGNIPVDALGNSLTTVTLPEDSWTVSVEVDPENGYWIAAPAGMATINVALGSTEKRVTGGGWVPDGESANGKANFAFTVNYQKNGNPKGNSLFVFKGEDGYNYLMKGNSWQGGGLSFTDDAAKAQFAGKCVVQKIDPATGDVVESWGNYSFTVDLFDGDQSDPRQPDKYAIAILDSSGSLWHQVGSQSSLVQLGGGNVAIQSNENLDSPATSTPAPTSTPEAPTATPSPTPTPELPTPTPELPTATPELPTATPTPDGPMSLGGD